jgi:hypothetical protein
MKFWSAIEKEKLYEGLKMYGRKWKKLADIVQTRNLSACKQYVRAIKPEELDTLDIEVKKAILNK